MAELDRVANQIADRRVEEALVTVDLQARGTIERHGEATILGRRRGVELDGAQQPLEVDPRVLQGRAGLEPAGDEHVVDQLAKADEAAVEELDGAWRRLLQRAADDAECRPGRAERAAQLVRDEAQVTGALLPDLLVAALHVRADRAGGAAVQAGEEDASLARCDGTPV